MDTAIHTCQCGCNQPIPPKRNHRFKAPRYLLGHASRDPKVKLQFAENIQRRHHERPETAPVYRCHCGCGDEIPWRPGHARRPPRYIQQHFLRDDTTERVKALRRVKKGARIKPPTGWRKPSGQCECGCGQRTKICEYSRPEHDQYIGYHKRWVQGHHAKAMLKKRGADNTSWKGGRFRTHDGYLFLYKPEHPSAQRDGYIAEHRFVYATTRGITLTNGIAIHHINGIKDDNRPENLVAYTRREHSIAHIQAAQLISLFLDDRLLEAAKAHVRSTGEMPDLEQLTQMVYGHSDHAAT